MPHAHLYHYTDDVGARNIMRSGKILASLRSISSDDAGYRNGNGVYLTQLKPQTSTRTEIAMNNWGKTTDFFINKTKNYFVLNIPDSDIKDVSANGRDVFLFGDGKDLYLHKFSWCLKNFDSDRVISCHKYQLSSFGPVSKLESVHQDNYLGEYTMSDETVNGRPVYKHDTALRYLFMSSAGNWLVGDNSGVFCQRSYKYSYGPDFNVSWAYFDWSLWKKYGHPTSKTRHK